MPSTTIKQKITTFKDLDLTFKPNPFNGDIVKKLDDDAVKMAIKTLVMTMTYERPFHPEISSPLYGLLFELASPITAQVIRTAIIGVINTFEPRANLQTVVVSPSEDTNSYSVTITFTMANYYEPFTVNLLLQRLR